MPHAITVVTRDVLQAFADAWNRHDVDALMSFMADDCVFEASARPDVCGTRYAGREAGTHATTCSAIGASRSGRSRARGPTAPAWRCTGVICSPSKAGGSA